MPLGAGRLIAFEGVDGAGKSTVIMRVAQALRDSGQRVFMPRTGKEHDSRPTRMIRRLTRDRRNLDLTPRAELLLYCAREAQVLSELVQPALDRGDTVLIDRSLITPMILGRARGLGEAECVQATALASGGVDPDLTLIFDVHPRTSRIRKRIERVRDHSLGEGGRKGLAGSAFKERVRTLYSEVAEARGHPLFHVERATPELLARRVIDLVLHDVPVREDPLDSQPQWLRPEGWTLEEGLQSLPVGAALFLSNGLICGRDLRRRAFDAEPALAAWAMDEEDPLREQAAEAQPEYALRGWNRRPLSGPDDLRLRLLDRQPQACIEALKHLQDPESDRLREQHAEQLPGAVVASLTGREDQSAWALRRRCWKRADAEARAASLGFCNSDEAWDLRGELLEDNPVLGLDTLRGLADPRSLTVLERYAELAPKPVLAALGGRSDAAAHSLRERLFETGREVVDSVRGLNDDDSWALRQRCVERWPSTVAHSLLGLDDDDQVASLTARCGELAGGDLHVLRRLQGLRERPQLPEWARSRTRDGLEPSLT